MDKENCDKEFAQSMTTGPSGPGVGSATPLLPTNGRFVSTIDAMCESAAALMSWPWALDKIAESFRDVAAPRYIRDQGGAWGYDAGH
jgi:hypothetical protein